MPSENQYNHIFNQWYGRLARTILLFIFPYITKVLTPHRNILTPSARYLDDSVP